MSYKQKGSCKGEKPLSSKPRRRHKNIIETSQMKSQRYVSAVQGSREETKELNIHLKTTNLYCMRLAQTQHELSPFQLQIIKKYQKMAPNFQSLRYLLHSSDPLPYEPIPQDPPANKKSPPKGPKDPQRHEIRKSCLRFYQSSDPPTKVLRSSRMQFSNKLTFIKYLGRIEEKVKKDWRARDGWKKNIMMSYSY